MSDLFIIISFQVERVVPFPQAYSFWYLLPDSFRLRRGKRRAWWFREWMFMPEMFSVFRFHFDELRFLFWSKE